MTAALGREQARAELFDAAADDLLLAHLGHHHHGHPQGEALRPPCSCRRGSRTPRMPQDFQLWDVGLHDEVGGGRPRSSIPTPEPVERTTWQSSPPSAAKQSR